MSSNWTERNIPDQHGRVAIVTGANTGLGFETARMLVARGAAVVAVRNVEKGRRAAARITGDVTVQALNLTSLDSIPSAAAELRAAHPRIDLLINNAGVMYTPKQTTADGFELQFGTNHLGHFARNPRCREHGPDASGRVHHFRLRNVALDPSGETNAESIARSVCGLAISRTVTRNMPPAFVYYARRPKRPTHRNHAAAVISDTVGT